MNVLLILNAQPLLLVKMKTVLILVNVQEMQIAQPEIIEEFVLANQDLLVIPMALLVLQVRLSSVL